MLVLMLLVLQILQPIRVPMPCKSCALRCVYKTYPDAAGNFLALCHEAPGCDDPIFKDGFENGFIVGPYEGR